MSGSAIRLDAIDTTQNMYIQRKQVCYTDHVFNNAGILS